MSYTAMALTKPHTIERISLETPSLSQDEVLVRVRAVNLCPTDIKKWRDPGLADALAAGPLILGHEIAGEIVECGPDAARARPGDRVAIDPILRETRADGREHLMGIGAAAGTAPDNVALLSDQGIGGGFAELVKVPEGNLIHLPDDVDFAAASLIEPLADIVHGIVKARDVQGKRCAVFGLGPMGLLHVELLNWLGADVIGVDPREDRRAEAVDFGAAVVVAPGSVPAADIAFVAAGGPALEPACTEALACLNKNGRLVIFASGTKGACLTLDLNAVHYANQQIIGVVGFRPEDAAQTIALLQEGAINVARIRSPRIDFDMLQEAFGVMGQPGTFKYGIDLDGG